MLILLAFLCGLVFFSSPYVKQPDRIVMSPFAPAFGAVYVVGGLLPLTVSVSLFGIILGFTALIRWAGYAIDV